MVPYLDRALYDIYTINLEMNPPDFWTQTSLQINYIILEAYACIEALGKLIANSISKPITFVAIYLKPIHSTAEEQLKLKKFNLGKDFCDFASLVGGLLFSLTPCGWCDPSLNYDVHTELGIVQARGISTQTSLWDPNPYPVRPSSGSMGSFPSYRRDEEEVKAIVSSSAGRFQKGQTDAFSFSEKKLEAEKKQKIEGADPTHDSPFLTRRFEEEEKKGKENPLLVDQSKLKREKASLEKLLNQVKYAEKRVATFRAMMEGNEEQIFKEVSISFKYDPFLKENLSKVKGDIVKIKEIISHELRKAEGFFKNLSQALNIQSALKEIVQINEKLLKIAEKLKEESG